MPILKSRCITILTYSFRGRAYFYVGCDSWIKWENLASRVHSMCRQHLDTYHWQYNYMLTYFYATCSIYLFKFYNMVEGCINLNSNQSVFEALLNKLLLRAGIFEIIPPVLQMSMDGSNCLTSGDPSATLQFFFAFQVFFTSAGKGSPRRRRFQIYLRRYLLQIHARFKSGWIRIFYWPSKNILNLIRSK